MGKEGGKRDEDGGRRTALVDTQPDELAGQTEHTGLMIVD
jgi:hypothetical protein